MPVLRETGVLGIMVRVLGATTAVGGVGLLVRMKLAMRGGAFQYCKKLRTIAKVDGVKGREREENSPRLIVKIPRKPSPPSETRRTICEDIFLAVGVYIRPIVLLQHGRGGNLLPTVMLRRTKVL